MTVVTVGGSAIIQSTADPASVVPCAVKKGMGQVSANLNEGISDFTGHGLSLLTAHTVI